MTKRNKKVKVMTITLPKVEKPQQFTRQDYKNKKVGYYVKLYKKGIVAVKRAVNKYCKYSD